MAIKDKDKKNEYQRAYYARNKDQREKQRARVKRNNKLYAARNKEIVADFRKDGCIICGESDPACLDAHHQDPNEKEHAVSNLAVLSYSVEKVKAELAKCVCVCSNCHRKIHAGSIVL